MSANPHDDSDRTRPSLESLTDPGSLREHPAVSFHRETAVHDDRDHCSSDVDGRAVVGVTNEDGELLLLVNRELGVAVLPHGTVAADSTASGDWATVARRDAEGQTGISIELDGIDAVRAVDHVVDGEDPHARTHRVVFRASPVDGEIQACKRDAAAGSDDWTAGWYDECPEGVAAPDGGPGDDLALFLETSTAPLDSQ